MIIEETLKIAVFGELCIKTGLLAVLYLLFGLLLELELFEAIGTAQKLAKKEGLMCGISSGTNVAAAVKLAKELGAGKTVVTVLPDTAERYFSTPLFE